jgi:hypothetical protein
MEVFGEVLLIMGRIMGLGGRTIMYLLPAAMQVLKLKEIVATF